ncbi:MAG: EsaB/YukD family protein [Thermoplasmata archaeon]|jgi:hypothetical protein
MTPDAGNDLTLTIQTAQGDWANATFPKTEKVSAVIQAVISHFGFSKSGNYELTLQGSTTPLKPERTLVSYGIKDGNVLIFTEQGTAV